MLTHVGPDITDFKYMQKQSNDYLFYNQQNVSTSQAALIIQLALIKNKTLLGDEIFSESRAR